MCLLFWFVCVSGVVICWFSACWVVGVLCLGWFVWVLVALDLWFGWVSWRVSWLWMVVAVVCFVFGVVFTVCLSVVVFSVGGCLLFCCCVSLVSRWIMLIVLIWLGSLVVGVFI